MEINRNCGSCHVSSGKADRPGFQPTIVLHALELTGPEGSACVEESSEANGLNRWTTRLENSEPVFALNVRTSGPLIRSFLFTITRSEDPELERSSGRSTTCGRSCSDSALVRNGIAFVSG